MAADLSLVEFLRARLDEDERVAQGAIRTDEGHGGHWVPVMFGGGGFDARVDARVDDHIARHDPARVLADVAARRAIVELHTPSYPVTYPSPSGQPTCCVCHAGGWDWDPEEWPCATVRHLAAVYSGHPDYREEWRPQ